MSPTVPVYISSFLPTWTQLSGRTSISPNGMAEGKTQQSPPLPALRWDKDGDQGQAGALFLSWLLRAGGLAHSS